MELIKYSSVNVYQEAQEVLSNVAFSIDKGEFVYIIGKVGSGKSSLLKTMYGELALKEGEATILDFDLMKLKQKHLPQLRRKLGVIFQDFQPYRREQFEICVESNRMEKECGNNTAHSRCARPRWDEY